MGWFCSEYDKWFCPWTLSQIAYLSQYTSLTGLPIIFNLNSYLAVNHRFCLIKIRCVVNELCIRPVWQTAKLENWLKTSFCFVDERRWSQEKTKIRLDAVQCRKAWRGIVPIFYRYCAWRSMLQNWHICTFPSSSETWRDLTLILHWTYNR